MPQIVTRPPANLRQYRAAIVSVETSPRIWLQGDPEDPDPVVWTAQPNVYLDRLRIQLNGIDQASLSYHYGRLKRFDGTAWADATPGALRRYYLRLTIEFHEPLDGEEPDFDNTSTLTWVGYIAETKYSYVQTSEPGTEQLTAVGLEWFLDRNKIYDSVLLAAAPTVISTVVQPPDTVRIERPQTFNGGTNGYTAEKNGTRGNKDKLLPLFFNRAIPAADYPKGVDLYPTRDPDSPALWNAAEIVDHTLTHHAPRDSAGLPKPVEFVTEWDIIVGEQLGGVTPTIRTEGRTALEVINDVANARRGIAWHISDVDFSAVELETGDATATISFHTLNQSAIVLPAGGTLPANANQTDIDITGDPTLAMANVQRKMTRSFNRVRAVGARMTSTFTLWSQQEENSAGFIQFDKKWTPDEQLRYQVGGLFDEDTEPEERFDAAANDKVRASDAVKNAYKRFGPPDDWNGEVGEAGFQSPVFPVVSSTGSFSGSLDVYVPAMRMLTRTRIPAGTGDYSDDFQPPRLYVQPDLDTEGTVITKGWKYADTLNEGDSELKAYRLRMADTDGLDFYVESTGDFAASLTTEDMTAAITEPPPGDWIGAYAYVDDDYDPAVDADSAIPMSGAVVIDDSGGTPPTFPSTRPIADLNAIGGEVLPGSLHYFRYVDSAWEKFDGWGPNEIVGEIGWNQLSITMAAEADRHCEGVYDATVAGFPIEELVIDAGEDYRLDFMAYGTVLDISANGTPLRSSGVGEVLRNDEGRLRDIARSAATYYREEPAEFELSWSRLHNLFSLGMMVNDIGAWDGETFDTIDTVDAVVASIEWDFNASRTTIKSLGIAAEPPRGQLT